MVRLFLFSCIFEIPDIMNLNDLAFNYIEYTHRHVLVSGKAGTGKTTLLKRIKSETHKNTVVVAPTGVAAINAGGVTIHSFFQLPFNTYVPEPSSLRLSDNVLNRDRLLSKHRFNRERLNIFKNLELLIIDEISMVRCDVMDMMNIVLQHVRQEYQKPFGGVQVLMVGDLYQLAPVIKEQDWQEMKPYYSSVFFFDSEVYRTMNAVNIELDKVYRQQDEQFISILNGVRNNTLRDDQYESLHKGLDETYEPRRDDGCIILTTHNQIADEVNNQHLTSIKKPVKVYTAKKEGTFDERNANADIELRLKVGAQVMFVKNDLDAAKRFFNGKIARVKDLNDEDVVVIDDACNEIKVTPYTWENIRYEHNAKENKINEEVIGRFKQLPLRLAWAITIHKSQGLTFDKVVIDAGRAFSPGQVYVALSRCRSLDGIILKSRISKNNFKTDDRILWFYASSRVTDLNEEQLLLDKIDYHFTLLLNLFNLNSIEKQNDQWVQAIEEHGKGLDKKYVKSLSLYFEHSNTLARVARRFQEELKQLHQRHTLPEENEQIRLRSFNAADYFIKQSDKILQQIQQLTLVSDNELVKQKLNSIEKSVFEMWYRQNTLWQACENGFSTIAHFNALKSYQQPRLTKVVMKCDTSSTCSQLKQILIALREDLCNEYQLSAHRVMPIKTIELLCEHLPLNESELSNIKGLDSNKVKRFGADILQVIRDYCRMNQIDPKQGLATAVSKLKQLKKKTATKNKL